MMGRPFSVSARGLTWTLQSASYDDAIEWRRSRLTVGRKICSTKSVKSTQRDAVIAVLPSIEAMNCRHADTISGGGVLLLTGPSLRDTWRRSIFPPMFLRS